MMSDKVDRLMALAEIWAPRFEMTCRTDQKKRSSSASVIYQLKW